MADRRPSDAFELLPDCRCVSIVHGCLPLAIGPSLFLLPVLETVCPDMSCHVCTLCQFSDVTQGFQIHFQAFLPVTFTTTFVVPARRHLSFSDT